jgi:tRNA(Ile)-lysidine synthase
LLNEIARQWPTERWRDLGVVVGCSGGADSVGLLCALASLRRQASQSVVEEAGFNEPGSYEPRGFLIAAHFNHRLRGEASEADQAFVEHLAQQLGTDFQAGAAVIPHADEAAMRSDRLQFLIDVAHARGARYIALAHSADDNVETVLHHLLRGTGPAGLCGIGSPLPIDEDLVLIRPLLSSRREQIRAALTDQGIAWREDASNLDPAYRRNWIRHHLIPLIQTEYPSGVEAIERAIQGQRSWRVMIDRSANHWLEQHLQSVEPLVLSRDETVEPAIAIAAAQQLWRRREWPRGDMTLDHWQRIAQTIAGNQPERYTLPGGIDVVALNDHVRLLPYRRGSISLVDRIHPDLPSTSN